MAQRNLRVGDKGVRHGVQVTMCWLWWYGIVMASVCLSQGLSNLSGPQNCLEGWLLSRSEARLLSPSLLPPEWLIQ